MRHHPNDPGIELTQGTATQTLMPQGVQLTPFRCRQWVDRLSAPAALCREGRIASVNRALLQLLLLADDRVLVGRPPAALHEVAEELGLLLHASETALSVHEESGVLWVVHPEDGEGVETDPGLQPMGHESAPKPTNGRESTTWTQRHAGSTPAAAAGSTLILDPTFPAAALARVEALAEMLWELPADASIPVREMLGHLRDILESADPSAEPAEDLSSMLTLALQQLDASRFRLVGDDKPMIAAHGARAAKVVHALLESSIADSDALVRIRTSIDATGAPTLEASRADSERPVLDPDALHRVRGLVQQLGGSLIALDRARVVRLRLPPAST